MTMHDKNQSNPQNLTRRDAILRVSAALGGVALVGQAAMLAGCSRDEPAATANRPAATGLFAADDVALLDEIADTILPETSTPGARAAAVGPFIALMVSDCYREPEQAIFRKGLAELERRCVAACGQSFVHADPEQRLAVLNDLDAEQHAYMQDRADDEPVHYFRMLKEQALLGYFTSSIGYNQAMRYREAPGRYDPCVPYADGDKAWAPHA